MKKILIAAGISVVALSAAFAQEVKQEAPKEQAGTRMPMVRNRQNHISPEAAAQRRTDRLTEELALSTDQQKKVYEMFLKQNKENQGRLVQNEETEQQLKAILTADQNTKYEAMKVEKKQMMQNRAQTLRSAEVKSPTPIK